MGLTNIATQLTPGRPTEITFDNVVGLANPNQQLVLIGHSSATGTASGSLYHAVQINNSGDPVAGAAEAAAKFGAGSELTLMVTAAIDAIADAGLTNYPPIQCIQLAPSDTGTWGPSNAALLGLNKVEAEIIASPYDAQTQQSLNSLLVAQAAAISGAQSVQNNQFGSIAVAANQSVVDPSTLFTYQSQFMSPVWFRNTVSPQYTVAQLAAAVAAVYASLSIPFNPLDSQEIGNLLPPTNQPQDNITVGGAAETETALGLGWTPLKVNPNLTVSIVRSITSIPALPTEAYIDVQDFQVLYYFRKTIYTNFNQPFWNKQKASTLTAQNILGEVIRLAGAMEDQGMFQAVSELAKQFVVQRNASDRSRFDIFIPVNVVPGLHVLATNIQAGTQFDQITL
jgi:phage tail sheath gpL-like